MQLFGRQTATILADAVSNLSAVLALSSTHVGIVQYPVYQSQTNQMTLVKHRHTLDNLLLKAGLTAYHPVLFLYEKPDSTARDGRSLSQMAMAVFHGNFDSCAFMESGAIKEGKLGPVPLIRIADLLGFDDVRRPGASARVEQKLVWSLETRFSFCWFVWGPMAVFVCEKVWSNVRLTRFNILYFILCDPPMPQLQEGHSLP